jgi:hypothetical protein
VAKFEVGQPVVFRGLERWWRRLWRWFRRKVGRPIPERMLTVIAVDYATGEITYRVNDVSA